MANYSKFNCASAWRAGAIGLFLLGTGLAFQSHAACTPTSSVVCLADQPIQSANIVKPNVMFILDNSGSMVWDLMSVDSALSENVNRARRCRKNFQYNTVYYNPNFDYTAARPRDASGNQMPSQSFTNALNDPFSGSNTRTNLNSSFCAVSAQCSSSQSNTDLRPRTAYYYKYTGAASPGSGCAADGNYVRVDVGSNSCQVSGDVTTCPTGADERTNFANWFTYFRTRVSMMKSGMATAFATIDDKTRVGFHTINNPGNGNSSGRSLNVSDFSATQKNSWYSALFSIAPSGGTPLQDALSRVGNYYSGSGTRTGLSGDPVQYSCQKNFAIMSTDGYYNSSTVNIGNWDRTVPASMPIKSGKTAYDPADTNLTQGANFPVPYYEGTSTSASNTLADVAMYYWVRDLRTTGGVDANNVPTTQSDPAYWQHMTTYTIGLGVNGTLAFPTALPTTTAGWPVPANDTLTAVDDLWHAAVNGRGQYYKATDPTSLSNSLTAALKAVSEGTTYGVGPTSSTRNFQIPFQTDLSTYETGYRIVNWSGDVKKYALSKTTGAKTGSPIWSASEKLDQFVNPGQSSNINSNQFTKRNIVTRTESGVVVPFDYDQLSANQQTALCYKASPGTGPCITSPKADRESVVNYLRGDGAFEGDYGTANKRFRNRKDKSVTTVFKRDLIGTIVNASPAYVSAEVATYLETSDPGYDAYKTSTKSRQPVLYVPANDGMVHAIQASTGDELWAYVPSLIIPTGLDSDGNERGLRALSHQEGGAPNYYHHFYIDSTPVAMPVDFARTGGPITGSSPSGNWRTILVGGLGKGGKGYYALDVTQPADSMSEAQASVLWEFPSPADGSHASVISAGKLGYSYGRPEIVKTTKWGWVVIVPSGYNNSDGYGHLFVLNAKTGALLETLDTTEPAPGLANISGLIPSGNRTLMQIYGGDLNGNLWRFDFGSPALGSRVSKMLTSSNSTPIATEPRLAIDPNNGNRWVFFGTGKYLDVPDRTTSIPAQYLVALRDGTFTTPKTSGLPVSLSSLTAVSDVMSGISNPSLGWRYQTPSAGERISIAPITGARTVFFATLVPTTDPCSPGLEGYAYGLGYETGKTRLMTKEGAPLARVYSSTGVSGISFVNTAHTSEESGALGFQISKGDGTTETVTIDTSGVHSSPRHVSWRELMQEY